MQGGYAQEYSELQKWHWWFRGRQRIVAAVLRRELMVVASRSILSVGCGPAEGLNWLVPFAGKDGKVVGLDAESIHARRLPTVDFVVGRLEETPFADSSFDVVLTLDVLEHLDDDTSGLREAVRLLKPGGLLLITVPALPSLWGNQDVVSEHHRRYTKRSLAHVCDAVGLSGYRLLYFNSILFPVVAMVRWGRRLFALSRTPRSDFDGGRPGILNDALAILFGAESHLIGRAPLPIGVSLLAIYSQLVRRDLKS